MKKVMSMAMSFVAICFLATMVFTAINQCFIEAILCFVAFILCEIFILLKTLLERSENE